MSKWPWHRRWTCQDASHELYMECIGQVVAGFQYPRDSWSTNFAHGYVHVGLMGKWPWRCTAIGHDISSQLNWGDAPCGCWVPASARFQESLLRPWTRPCDADRHIAMTLPIYRPRWFQWTWFGVKSVRWLLNYGVHKVPRAFSTPVVTPMWPRWANDQLFLKLCFYKTEQNTLYFVPYLLRFKYGYVWLVYM